jgi:nucleotide-binding universal stress UspA family protein
MFKRILVPVDGSPTSERGLNTAIKMAKTGGSTLLLLHVVDETVLTQTADYGGGAYVDRLLESLRDGGKVILAKTEKEVQKHGVKFKSVLNENLAHRVADVIIDQARKLRADTIVMGTHGRRGITRMVMGSDAEGVVRGASVPVLLVRSEAPKRRGRSATARRV